MPLSWIFESELLPWYVWVTPAAGLVASLAVLMVGRFVLSRGRSRVPQAVVVAPETPPPAEAPAPQGPDPFDHGSVTERRCSLRRKGSLVEVQVSDEPATREPVKAWVFDRSMGGLGLLLDDEVTVGTVLSLRARNAPRSTPWVQVAVRSCKKDSAGYEVGCEFLRTPPWNILLLFG
jgi:hypothetical protein